MGLPGSWSICRKLCLSLPGGLMSIINVISRISFKRKCQWVQKLVRKTAANDVLWLSRAKKSCLRPNLRVLQASWCKMGVFSGFARSLRAFWVLVGPKRTPNDKVMTVLVNTGPLYGSPWKNFIFPWRFLPHPPKFCVHGSGDIVSTYILTDARNALLFLAVTHISYSMPHGENKENKAYNRWIFLKFTAKWDCPDDGAFAESCVCPYQGD